MIVGGAGSPVKFLSSRPEAQAGTDDWRGIIIKPGAYFSINNAIIRHAYAGIEDSSQLSHTIQNVKIGRCKMYGILARNNADNLTIRGCRVDSVDANPGGYGIYVYAGLTNGVGAVLKRDTVRGSYYGIWLEYNKSLVDSCVVFGTGVAGIVCKAQGSVTPVAEVPIKNTLISGFFTEHLRNEVWGRSVLTGCNLISSTSPNRTSVSIRNTYQNAYLKARQNQIAEWGWVGVLVDNVTQVTDLGDAAAGDDGLNYVYTGASGSGWRYVWDEDSGTPTIKAENNCWADINPPASRFSSNIDYNPFDLALTPIY